MTTYYAVVEHNARVIAEYPVAGGEAGEVATQVARDVGAGWTDDPTTVWVRLRPIEDELAEPVYYRRHELPSGRYV